MQSLTIEQWPIDRPVAYARNARKISPAAVDKVSASIKEFGWRQPIVVDPEGVIVCGHTRLLAAKKLGLTEVPVHVASDLTPAQIKTFRIMDNRSHDEAKWDLELLAPELSELQAMSVDLLMTGFDGVELAKLMESNPGLTDPDAVPDPPAAPTTVAGDLWSLGRHRLLCGDSTCATDVERVLGGVKPLLMVTDPPYGVEYDAGWRNTAKRADGTPIGASAIGKVTNDTQADWREAYALFPGDVAYVWHAGNKAHVVAEGLEASGFEIRAQIIWAKSQFVIGRGHYHPHHEPCWYVVKHRQGATGHWTGDRKQTTLWQIDKPQKSETGHSTQKPVECMKRPMENNSSPGQAVYDPFLGSGTSIIAAEMTGRSCIGLEISPIYCDVIIKRWEQFTGLKATLADGPYKGSTFEQAQHGRRLAAQDAIKEEILAQV